jgi:hypothetical protein
MKSETEIEKLKRQKKEESKPGVMPRIPCNMACMSMNQYEYLSKRTATYDNKTKEWTEVTKELVPNLKTGKFSDRVIKKWGDTPCTESTKKAKIKRVNPSVKELERDYEINGFVVLSCDRAKRQKVKK